MFLIAFQQSVSSSQKTAWAFALIDKPFIYFFAMIVFTLTLATIFVSASFLPKVSKVKERG
jgi:hypothetical protein